MCLIDLYLGGANLLTDPQILTSGCVIAHSQLILSICFFFFFAHSRVLGNSAMYSRKATSQRHLSLLRPTTYAIISAEHLACPRIMNRTLPSSLNKLPSFYLPSFLHRSIGSHLRYITVATRHKNIIEDSGCFNTVGDCMIPKARTETQESTLEKS